MKNLYQPVDSTYTPQHAFVGDRLLSALARGPISFLGLSVPSVLKKPVMVTSNERTDGNINYNSTFRLADASNASDRGEQALKANDDEVSEYEQADDDEHA